MELSSRSPTRFRSVSELDAIKALRGRGLSPLRRGWPDYYARREDGQMVAVEAKRVTGSGDQWLKYEQTVCMAGLAHHGVHCFVAYGERLEPFELGRHGHPRYLAECGVEARHERLTTTGGL